MDRIADALDLDRSVVRERNLIQADQFPYDHHLTFQDGRPVIYDSGDYPGLMAKLKTLVGWDEAARLRDEATARSKLLGIGMAMYVEGTGPGPYEGGHVQVLGSGKVLVSTGLTSQGQGHETAFAQIVASELGVPIEDIEVTTGDTRRFGYAVGTFASRAAVMSGNAIALAARGVKEKALRIAADVLEVDPGDLEIDEGLVQELRRRFDGPLVANSGFGTVTTREEAVALIDSAHADAVAVGRPVIANPDLVERWAGQHPENAPDASTFYAAGAEGYTDYPVLARS